MEKILQSVVDRLINGETLSVKAEFLDDIVKKLIENNVSYEIIELNKKPDFISIKATKAVDADNI